MQDLQEDLINVETAVTLDGLFHERVRRSPEATAYRYFDKASRGWRDCSWRETAARAARWQVAIAADGLEAGERVAIQLRNSIDWVCFDQAALAEGLVTVPLYTEDRPDNTTRFLVLGRELFPPSGNDRTSILVFIKDEPGALAHLLGPLAEHNVTMNRIESRPAHGGNWQYAFFIDIGGHVDSDAVRAALKEMAPFAWEIRILGSYPVAVP